MFDAHDEVGNSEQFIFTMIQCKRMAFSAVVSDAQRPSLGSWFARRMLVRCWP
jgi:hypothetical protein